KQLRYPLERCGAIVRRTLRIDLPDGGHRHTSELLRYDQAYPERRRVTGGIDELVVAADGAAVFAPGRAVRKWVSWTWWLPGQLAEHDAGAGRQATRREGQPPEHDVDQGRLAAAVRPGDRDPVAPAERQVERAQRERAALGDGVLEA